MQDTAIPQSFVLLNCEICTISAEFVSTTADSLAADLSRYNRHMIVPISLDWRAVALQVFSGGSVLFWASNTPYVLVPAPISFFAVAGNSVLEDDLKYWTFEQSEDAYWEDMQRSV